MGQSYTGRDGGGGEDDGTRPGAAADGGALAPLLAQLHPGVDAGLLLAALAAERGGAPRADPAAARELERVRGLLALGERSREVQHALNNPLAALLAEAQLLQLDVLTDEQRQSVERIVALARRMVGLTRELSP